MKFLALMFFMIFSISEIFASAQFHIMPLGGVFTPQQNILNFGLSNQQKIDTVLKEVQCKDYYYQNSKLKLRTHTTREEETIALDLPVDLAINQIYIGQTIEGDIISFEKKQGKNTFTLYYCDRPGFETNYENPQFSRLPTLSLTNECVVGDVTTVDIELELAFKDNPLILLFYPLGFSEPSSLCSVQDRTKLDPLKVNQDLQQKTQSLNQEQNKKPNTNQIIQE
ncbi:MAG: hypothetical protein HON90_01680 [Halobacteriovoraceae bacterium]|jgi:hypothetical protein|nr:hypothetical protein [Halobacteriovoraceae bacterium]